MPESDTSLELLWRGSDVVDLCRTLACDSRLAILSEIAEAGAVTPGQIAKKFDLPASVASDHVRRLVRVGLVQDLDAGHNCMVKWRRAAECTTMGKAVRVWLSPLLKDAKTAVQQLPADMRPDDWQKAPDAALHQLLFRIASGFANARRLAIFKHLDTNGSCAMGSIIGSLQVPRPSARWHIQKLVRRGFVGITDSARKTRYHVPRRLPSPIHAGFLQIIGEPTDS